MAFTELEEILLGTFSFYSPLIREHVILQMDEKAIKSLPEVNMDDLDKACKRLERKGLLKKVKVGPDTGWIRLFPPKKPWIKWFRYFKSFF